jgi:hypothetical protein
MQYFCLTHKKSTLILATIFRSIKQVFAYPLHHSAVETSKKRGSILYDYFQPKTMRSTGTSFQSFAQLL